mmetsp:Transcript_9508/g.28344  ORF Transcript_9508/g.28344 Transcript_9508/m.28344 type:complete len:204 (-) Transcript_9508:57-668(-)
MWVLQASASKGPKFFSWVTMAVSTGAKTVKGPGPLRMSATPVDLRRSTKRPKLSYPLRSDSSFPTAIPSAPQTCPGPSRVSRTETMDPPAAGAAAAGAAAAGAAAAGAAAAGAAAAGAAAPASAVKRDLRYSSKEGAAEMDLRGSSSSNASGSRVSAIPPAPKLGPLKSAVERAGFWAGAKAEAPPTRAARRAILLMDIILFI